MQTQRCAIRLFSAVCLFPRFQDTKNHRPSQPSLPLACFCRLDKKNLIFLNHAKQTPLCFQAHWQNVPGMSTERPLSKCCGVLLCCSGAAPHALPWLPPPDKANRPRLADTGDGIMQLQ